MKSIPSFIKMLRIVTEIPKAISIYASLQRHMNQVQCHLRGNVDVLEPSSAQTAFEKKKRFCSEQNQTVLVKLFERVMKWSVSKRLCNIKQFWSSFLSA